MVNVKGETNPFLSFLKEGQRGVGVSIQPWALPPSQLQSKSMAEPMEERGGKKGKSPFCGEQLMAFLA